MNSLIPLSSVCPHDRLGLALHLRVPVVMNFKKTALPQLPLLHARLPAKRAFFDAGDTSSRKVLRNKDAENQRPAGSTAVRHVNYSDT
jgi:hypothetical protein